MDERQLREMHRYHPDRQEDHTESQEIKLVPKTHRTKNNSHTISESSDQPATLYLTINLVHYIFRC